MFRSSSRSWRTLRLSTRQAHGAICSRTARPSRCSSPLTRSASARRRHDLSWPRISPRASGSSSSFISRKARAEASAELGRAKDEMVSLVSHEMRTPLASIVGFTELLTTREVTAEQRKEYLSVMLQEGHRLTALINDFLDLRRIEGGHMTMSFAPADIGALIKRAVELFGESGETRSRQGSPGTCRWCALTATRYSGSSPTCSRMPASTRRTADRSSSARDWSTAWSRSRFKTRASAFPPTPSPTSSRSSIASTPPIAARSGAPASASPSARTSSKRMAARSAPGPRAPARARSSPSRSRSVASSHTEEMSLVVEDDSGFAHLLQAELSGREYHLGLGDGRGDGRAAHDQERSARRRARPAPPRLVRRGVSAAPARAHTGSASRWS